MNRPINILICDDDENIISSIRLSLEQHGISVESVAPAELPRAIESIHDVLLLDVYLGPHNGIDLLKKIVRLQPNFPVIMISGLAEMSEAVEAVRLGAYDFIEKPLKPQRLLVSVRNAARFGKMKKKQAEAPFIVQSPLMRGVTAKAAKVAATESTVLILGESGSGKDVLAKYIHAQSGRSTGPLIKLNCGAIPDTLIESELFGHKKGAFTGAVKDYSGKIQAAEGGTIFLDEIGELPLAVQTKLLRFLESREIQRVGEERIITVNARIIAATNRNIEQLVEEKQFREDLYYRLNIFPLILPPLRKRREEIVPLAEHFLEELSAATGTPKPVLSGGAGEYLSRLLFPGNVRELRSVIERLLILSGSVEITADDVRDAAAGRLEDAGEDMFSETIPLSEAKRKLELRYINVQLVKHGGSIQKTAEALGLLPNNLSRRIKQLKEE